MVQTGLQRNKKIRRYKRYFTWKVQFLERFNKTADYNKFMVQDIYIYKWLRLFKNQYPRIIFFRFQQKYKISYTYMQALFNNKRFFLNKFFIKNFFWAYSFNLVPYSNKYICGINYRILNKNIYTKFTEEYQRYFVNRNIVYENKYTVNSNALYNFSKKSLSITMLHKEIYYPFIKFLNLLYFKYKKTLDNFLNILFFVYYNKN